LRPTTIPRSGIAQDATQRGGTHERSDCRCWPGDAGAQRRPPQRGGLGRHGLAGRHAWLKVAGKTWADHFHDGQGTGPTKAQAEAAAVRAWTDVTAWELRAALGEMAVVGAQIGELLRQPRQYQLQRLLTALHLLGVRAGPPFRHFASRGGACALTGILGVIRADLIWSAPERLRHQSLPVPPTASAATFEAAASEASPSEATPTHADTVSAAPRKARCAPGLGP